MKYNYFDNYKKVKMMMLLGEEKQAVEKDMGRKRSEEEGGW
jgi:hypothetical protein